MVWRGMSEYFHIPFRFHNSILYVAATYEASSTNITCSQMKPFIRNMTLTKYYEGYRAHSNPGLISFLVPGRTPCSKCQSTFDIKARFKKPCANSADIDQFGISRKCLQIAGGIVDAVKIVASGWGVETFGNCRVWQYGKDGRKEGF